MRMPVELKAIAPIAQPLSGWRYSSGISLQMTWWGSGIVPWGHFTQRVGSEGCRIWKQIRLCILNLVHKYFNEVLLFLKWLACFRKYYIIGKLQLLIYTVSKMRISCLRILEVAPESHWSPQVLTYQDFKTFHFFWFYYNMYALLSGVNRLLYVSFLRNHHQLCFLKRPEIKNSFE